MVWLWAVHQAESKLGSSDPMGPGEWLFPSPPVGRSILSFNKSISPRWKLWFLWKGHFPAQMPTQSGNYRGPNSGKPEKVKGSLKAIWEHAATSVGGHIVSEVEQQHLVSVWHVFWSMQWCMPSPAAGLTGAEDLGRRMEKAQFTPKIWCTEDIYMQGGNPAA